MKKTLLILLALIVFERTFSQVCTIEFATDQQSEIDNFLINNPECTVIDGSVIIENYNPNDLITQVNGFANITEITGNLFILNYTTNSAIDLSGFSNLTTVGGMLSIAQSNPDGDFANNLYGLHNLSSVGTLNLENLSTVTNLDVFNNITSVSNIALIGVFDALSTPVFNQLESTNGTIYFNQFIAPQLTGFDNLLSAESIQINLLNTSPDYDAISFNAFNALNTVETYILLEGKFDSMIGFDQLQTCPTLDCNLQIQSAYPSFPSLSFCEVIYLTGATTNSPAFNALQSCEYLNIFGQFDSIEITGLTYIGSLDIQGTPPEEGFSNTNSLSLPNLTQLGNLTLQYLEITEINAPNLAQVLSNLQITNCPNLTICDNAFICEKLFSAPELIFVWENGQGCSEFEDLFMNCSNSLISGNVYADLNCNGIHEINEPSIPYPQLLDEMDMQFGASTYNGNYFISTLPNNTYTFNIAPISGIIPSNAITINITEENPIISDIDFPLCPDLNFHDVSISMATTPFMPGFDNQISIIVQNHGYNPESVSIQCDLSILEMLTINYCNFPFTINASSIDFGLINLNPGETVQIDLIVKPAINTALGTNYSIVAQATSNSSEYSYNNNEYVHEDVVIGSYDPNDITVDRAAINFENINENGEWLQYQIRFQNTGNAPAQFINVINEQDLALDLSTLQIIGTSHNCEISFNDREITWFFDNIQLPDSTSDPLGSQGFILFRIKTNPGIELEDIIESTAAIYFDYNEPVITNTATTVFYICPAALIISGNTEYCDGEVVTLNASQNYNQYNWLLDGQNISTDPNFVMTLSSGNYYLSLDASTDYCVSTTGINIVVNEIPDTPSIMNNGNTLFASGSGNFNWTFNGDPIDESANSITITESGVYGVSVTENGCTSGTSQNDFTYIQVDEEESSELRAFPNPANDFITVQLPKQTQSITIRDLSGKLVYEQRNIVSKQLTLELSFLERGTYIIEFNAPTGKLYKTITKL